MKIIDTKGRLCPEPLIMARNGLREVSEGDKMQVISDNDTSYQNLMSFLEDLGAKPVADKKDGIYTIEVTKPAESQSEAESNPEAYCAVPQPAGGNNDYVVVARSCRMGEGDDDLGSLLIRGYFNALKEMDQLPTHIIMYNGGVKLAVKDTDTAAALAELEDKDVSVLVCGTCVDYFKMKDQIGVGVSVTCIRLLQHLPKQAK
ncbi:sulfurtransferase-like selenium metabolism protein YedF [Marinilabilia salmonicolor]|uniref:sulfurtransferase-like selenium metabolism protein YedF n=1 Tax=Marinilabilia salmonicolor TaxID=989 RepID=UPI001F15B93A|nr:sulfurtransferase-like selenium metabolism protein YedF [Marinilabilia salmonicolor]